MTRRRALVTGAASGIGAAIVAVLAQAGWRVAGVDRNAAPAGLAADPFFEGDVAEEATWAAIHRQLAADAGHLDALVNNAAMQICKPVTATSLQEWETVMASNLTAPFLAVRALAPLLAGGGAVVNVSSVHALATSADISAYAASKGGLLAFTRALAVELAGQGIRANAVLPGAVDTPMLRDGLSRFTGSGGDVSEQARRLAARTVLGRIARPEEIAQAVLFLADPARSSFVTGHGLVVDGGVLARLGTE